MNRTSKMVINMENNALTHEHLPRSQNIFWIPVTPPHQHGKQCSDTWTSAKYIVKILVLGGGASIYIYMYAYFINVQPCCRLLMFLNVFGWHWWNHMESMWKSLFLCPWRSNALHTRTPAAPLSVSGGHTFRLDPTFKSIFSSRCISWGGYEWTAQLDATHLEPGMGH